MTTDDVLESPTKRKRYITYTSILEIKMIRQSMQDVYDVTCSLFPGNSAGRNQQAAFMALVFRCAGESDGVRVWVDISTADLVMMAFMFLEGRGDDVVRSLLRLGVCTFTRLSNSLESMVCSNLQSILEQEIY